MFQSEEFGGTFGNKDDFKGIGVFFDTYDNDGQRDNPTVYAISSDGSLRFDHERDGTGQKLSNVQCNLNYRNPRNPVSVKINYQAKVLKVFHDIHGNSDWSQCFQTEQVSLPDHYYIGLTAHTGQVADNHDIYFLKVSNLGTASTNNAADLGSAAAAQGPTAVPDRTNQSAEEQHQWKPDDDRHLARYADSIANWAAKSPEEQQRLAEERKAESANRPQPSSQAADGGQAATSGQAAEASDLQAGPAAATPQASDAALLASLEEEKRAVRDAAMEQRHFRDEVSATLAIIQSEVKAIAHEMRGTITLAHAMPQGGGGGDGDGGGGAAGGGGGGSMSEVVSSLSDVVQHMQRAVSDDIATARDGLRLQLEALQRDQNALTATLASSSGRDAAAGVARQLQELRQAIETLRGLPPPAPVAGTGAGERRQVAAAAAAAAPAPAGGSGGGGGVSWLVLGLSHVPWIAYVAYGRLGGRGRDSFIPTSRANKHV